jgi:HEXXH motif-containing protein
VLPGVGLVVAAPVGTMVQIDCDGTRLVGRVGSKRCLEAGLVSSVGPVRMALGTDTWVLPSFSIAGTRLHIDVHDPAFVEGWIPNADFSSIGVDLARAEDLETWRGALEEASRLMERVLPATASMLGWVVRSFVPVVSRDGSISCSMSDAMLPGAIMSTIDGAPVLAESLAHEFRHNLLHQLELAYPIFEPGSPSEARFYSPWRTDPRPLCGILHALFVFIDVCAIHAGVRAQRLGDAHDQHDSAVRLTANMRRIRIALEEFRRHAQLTAFGCGFVQGIEYACDAFEPALTALPTEAVHQAEQEVAQHRARWRPA